MKYYALEFDLSEKDPEGKVLWETESEMISETMKLAIPFQKPNHEYEVISESEIMDVAQKYYDTDEFPLLH